MDEQAVREHAQAHCDALLAGDIGKAAEEMSKELRANLGSIVGMLPLPLTEATVESLEMTPHGYRAVLHLVGEGGTLSLETRWKDRDGRPTMVEASRVHEEPVVAPTGETEATQGEDH
jgi:hypothetical protein